MNDGDGGETKRAKGYFWGGLVLGAFIGLYSLIPLCIYDPLKEPSQKRTNYIRGTLAGMCIVVVIGGISGTVVALSFGRAANAIAQEQGKLFEALSSPLPSQSPV